MSRPLRVWLPLVAILLLLSAHAQIAHEHIEGRRIDGVTRAEVIGDVDGDGVEDLVVCIHAGFPNFQGAFMILSGRDFRVLVPRVSGQSNPNEGPTSWVTGAGDFNGDGIPDVIRGSPDWGLGFSPRFRVFSGVDGSTLHDFPDPGVNDWGAAVAPLGDVDGDGFGDVILGEEYGDNFFVYGGPDGHLIREHRNLIGQFISVRSIGDIDLDGVPDYAFGLGAWNAVRVHSGATGAVLLEVTGQGQFPLGLDVCGVGDLDGDGRAEFAASAGVGNFSSAAPGEVFVFRGSDGAVLFHFRGEGTTVQTAANLGMFLDGGRDVNGDGVPDLIASAPLPWNRRGEPGYVNVYSLRTGTLLWNRRRTDTTAENLRYCRLFGDLDGDGLSEWGFGDSHADYSAFGAGRIWIYRGAPGDADEFCAATPNSTGAAARLLWEGPTSVGHPRMKMRLVGAPPNSFAVWFYGVAGSPTPAGAGSLCLSAPLVRLSPPVALDAAGEATLTVDWLNGPQASGPLAWSAGSAWAVQALYRDAGTPPGVAPIHTTSAWRVVFLP